MSTKSVGECLTAKRTFVGRSPRPCERAVQAEPERCGRKGNAGKAWALRGGERPQRGYWKPWLWIASSLCSSQ